MEIESKTQQEDTEIQEDSGDHAVLILGGMTCASCAMRIEKGLKKLPGITQASVNLATEQATVTYHPAQTDLQQMVEKVEILGYTASPQLPQQQFGSAASVSGARMEATREEERNKQEQSGKTNIKKGASGRIARRTRVSPARGLLRAPSQPEEGY